MPKGQEKRRRTGGSKRIEGGKKEEEVSTVKARGHVVREREFNDTHSHTHRMSRKFLARQNLRFENKSRQIIAIDG